MIYAPILWTLACVAGVAIVWSRVPKYPSQSDGLVAALSTVGIALVAALGWIVYLLL